MVFPSEGAKLSRKNGSMAEMVKKMSYRPLKAMHPLILTKT
jgi:hypothetical protein